MHLPVPYLQPRSAPVLVFGWRLCCGMDASLMQGGLLFVTHFLGIDSEVSFNSAYRAKIEIFDLISSGKSWEKLLA
jgi:hypothetical protein